MRPSRALCVAVGRPRGAGASAVASAVRSRDVRTRTCVYCVLECVHTVQFRSSVCVRLRGFARAFATHAGSRASCKRCTFKIVFDTNSAPSLSPRALTNPSRSRRPCGPPVVEWSAHQLARDTAQPITHQTLPGDASDTTEPNTTSVSPATAKYTSHIRTTTSSLTARSQYTRAHLNST